MEAILTNEQSIENPYHRTSYPLLLIISGPSGVGKDSVVRALLEESNQFHFVVTATSRPARPGEVEGVDYIFVTEEMFEDMIREDELLEYAFVHDNYKGVPKQQIREAMASGKDVILRVDPQGAATLRDIVPNAIYIFLMAESEEVMMQRLRSRNTETSSEFDLRIEIARQEIQRIDEFDYCVVNRNNRLEDTVHQILCILEAERCRTKREPINL